jgi:hypothetical protein
VYQDILGDLVKQTKMGTDLRTITVWAIHFDPFSTDPTLQLLDSDLLVEASEAAGVDVILCGHSHETKIKPLNRRTTVCACGTTSQAGAPFNDCQVLQFVTDDIHFGPPEISVLWLRYDVALGRFDFLKKVTL